MMIQNLKHIFSIRRVSLVLVLFQLFNLRAVGQQFTEQTNISLATAFEGNSTWGDYDNDGDLDILITGCFPSKIYKNNGGVFAEQIGIVINGISYGEAAWGDYDNDGDLDIIITGLNSTGSPITSIYNNNLPTSIGFTAQLNISLIPLSYSSVAWGDYDTDGDLDILLCGLDSSGNRVTKVYKNLLPIDTAFVEQIAYNLPGVQDGAVSWGDYDNDGDLDILLTGTTTGYYSGAISKIYRNNCATGNGFVEQTSFSLIGVSHSSVCWGDYDNDGYLDILLTGEMYSHFPVSIVYRNSGSVLTGFYQPIGITLPAVSDGNAVWGDYDNDGNLDIIIVGNSSCKIYRNNGYSGYNWQNNIALPSLSKADISWADYDNDGDLDFLIMGKLGTGSTNISKVYKNNITISNTTPSVPISLSAQVLGDNIHFRWNRSIDDSTASDGLSYNIRIGSSLNSGDIKYPHSFISNGFNKIATLGEIQDTFFVMKTPIGLPECSTLYWSVQAVDVSFAASAFSSVDSISNAFSIEAEENKSILSKDTTQISVNHNACNSVSYSWSPSSSLSNSTIRSPNAFPIETTTYKVTVTEGANVRNDSLKVYVNSFVEESTISLIGLHNVSICWGDYDNDGDLDFITVGNDSLSGVTALYKNEAPLNTGFSLQSNVSFINVLFGDVAWGDYDNDGDIDLLISGWDSIGNSISKIYKNNLPISNSFIEQNGVSLVGVAFGSVSWADYDNDGDLDILMTGRQGASFPFNIMKIYKNNRPALTGFTEQSSIVLQGVFQSTAVWGDYDNDGDLDILMTGRGGSNLYTKIYDNNALLLNGFSEKSGMYFQGVAYGEALWGDYDGDGDLDILLTGEDASGNKIAKVYKNNGAPLYSFTEQYGILLDGVSKSSSAWGDFNNDGHLDILIAGEDKFGQCKTTIYRNDGKLDNNFYKEEGFSLKDISEGDVTWADYDNDGDLDVLLSGKQVSSPYNICKIYENVFPIPNSPPSSPTGLNAHIVGDKIVFTWNKAVDDSTTSNALSYNIRVGSNLFDANLKNPQSDLNSGFHRIVESGVIQDTFYIMKAPVNLSECSKLYWSVQSIDAAYLSSTFSNVDSIINTLSISAIATDTVFPGDTAQLSVVHNACGQVNYSWTPSPNLSNPSIQSPEAYPKESTTYYINLTVGNKSRMDSVRVFVKQFSKINNLFNEKLSGTNMDWGDYDNDGDLDILITGLLNINYPIFVSRVYKNDGNASFTLQSNISLIGVANGDVAWGDYDNDGDLDIFLTGTSNGNHSGAVSIVYKNEGNNTFSLQSSISLEGVLSSSITLGDYDNDGDLDILLAGANSTNTSICKVYRNNLPSSLGFTEQNSFSLTGVSGGDVDWGDYDNDGDLDILLSGLTDFSNTIYVSKVYKNNGPIGIGFTEQVNISLTPVYQSSVSWGDYDNDGDLDILLAGKTGLGNCSKVYKNNGNNIFIEQTGFSLIGVEGGSALWADYDNDGNLDITLTGNSKSNHIISKVYRGLGSLNNFVEQKEIGFLGSYIGSTAWADYDNDGDLDIIFMGRNDLGRSIVFYRNNSFNKNNKPVAPKNLKSQFIGDSIVLFSWDLASDNNTSQDGLSYNLEVGFSPSTVEVSSPQSDLITGFRRVASIGNIQRGSYYLQIDSNYHDSTYFWSVQTIDNGFVGSDFSSQKSFKPSSIGFAKNDNNKLNIKILPNPNNGVFYIEVNIKSKKKEKYKIKIFNVVGVKVYDAQLDIDEYYLGKISLGSLSAGMYFLYLEGGNQNLVLRFAVK